MTRGPITDRVVEQQLRTGLAQQAAYGDLREAHPITFDRLFNRHPMRRRYRQFARQRTLARLRDQHRAEYDRFYRRHKARVARERGPLPD